jgi:2-phosphosulfolactate phosphatase
MTHSVRCHLVPEQITPGSLQGSAAVVIDLLRASTTITHALGAGAACVIPVLTIEDARRARGKRHEPRTFLAGERAGLRIDGFDFGNSPAEFTTDAVAGATVIFTTTNGTKAILASLGARRVLVGCFANISALESELRQEEQVHLVCAGTDGEPTLEDALFAGAIAARLAARGFTIGNDQARLAIELWNGASSRPDGVLGVLRESRGGRNLLSIGLSRDIDECARVDTRLVVPELHGERLLPARNSNPR